MLGRYEEIVQQIRKKLPETKLYLLAYYPVDPTVAEDPGLIECFRSVSYTHLDVYKRQAMFPSPVILAAGSAT